MAENYFHQKAKKMIRFLNVEEIDVETYFSNILVELYI